MVPCFLKPTLLPGQPFSLQEILARGLSLFWNASRVEADSIKEPGCHGVFLNTNFSALTFERTEPVGEPQISLPGASPQSPTNPGRLCWA